MGIVAPADEKQAPSTAGFADRQVALRVRPAPCPADEAGPLMPVTARAGLTMAARPPIVSEGC